MKRHIQILILMLSLTLNAAAQSDDTQGLPPLTEDYYNGVTFLKQNYNYELVNKKRALKKRSKDLIVCGGVIGAAGVIAGSFLAANNGWSEAVTIPLGTSILLGSIYAFSTWSSHLSKKADAIQVETAYVLPVGRNTDLGAAVFTNRTELGIHAVGIGLKTSF